MQCGIDKTSQPLTPPDLPLFRAGTRFLLVGAGGLLLLTVIIALNAGVPAIDLNAIILLLLLPAARRGSVTAITWMLVFLGGYLINTSMLSYVTITDPSKVITGDFRQSGITPGVALVLFGLVWVWSLLLFRWGWNARKLAVRLRRYRQKVCMVCKYDLNGNESGCCPECGTIQHILLGDPEINHRGEAV